MMKTLCYFSLLLLTACGGELSREQKSRIRESMEDGQIRKVSPADLTVAAYELGRTITKRFTEDKQLQDTALVHKVSDEFGVDVFVLKEGVNAGDRAAQILEAYMQADDVGNLEDNVQKLGKDSLLYTQPINFERPDGSRVFTHAIAVTMPVKSVIRSMPE